MESSLGGFGKMSAQMPTRTLWAQAALALVGAVSIAFLLRKYHKEREARDRFKGKVVWVTGASSGIGRALCLALSRAGIKRLIISSRSEASLIEVQKLCINKRLPATNITLLPLDLAQLPKGTLASDVVQQALDAATEGRIDMLINNGGVSVRGLAEETSMNVDQHIMYVNYFGTVALTKALLPHMLSHKEGGHICVVSSLQGKFGTPARSAYAASKHALQGFFESLRLEVEHKNIDVTIACPGYVKTNLSLNALKGDGKPHGEMDDNTAKGMEPHFVADKILLAIGSREPEIVIASLTHSLAVPLNTFWPSMLRRILRKKYEKEQQHQMNKND